MIILVSSQITEKEREIQKKQGQPPPGQLGFAWQQCVKATSAVCNMGAFEITTFTKVSKCETVKHFGSLKDHFANQKAFKNVLLEH